MKRTSAAALLIIDMINDLDFEGADDLRANALEAAKAIVDLRAQASRYRMPVIYVNDNFGQWHSERSKLVEHCMREGSHGADMVSMLVPRDNDLFVIKPRFSGFYSTNLAVLLPELGVDRLVLTGVSSDICVLFTAADAHMREYEIWVPQNCVASENDERLRWSLEIMRQSMAAETRPTSQLPLKDWISSRSG